MTAQSPSIAAAAAAFPARAYAWFVVAALSLLNMVSYVERQILTLLFAPIKADFKLTDTQVSLLAGAAFVVFYVLFGLLFGRLADRSNRKRIILLGAVFWSLATTACGLAQNFVQLFIARISVGVGESSLGPSALSTIADTFPRDRLARPISIYTGSQYAGAGLALVVGGLAIHLVANLPPLDLPGLPPLRPWQMTFVLVGLFGALALIPMLFVREPPRRGVAKPAPAGAKSRSELLAFLGGNRRLFIAHFAAFSISSMLGFGTVAWVPTYFIRVHGWAAQDVGYAYGGVLAVMGALGVVAGGRIAEWMQGRGVRDAYFVLPMMSLCATAAFFVSAMLLAPSGEVALALIVCSTFLSSIPVALIVTTLQAVSPNQLRGQVTALYYFLANILGVASGPTVVALLTDYVFRDEMAVGRSLATASLVITPIVVVILAFGRRGLRDSLAQAATRDSPSL